LSTLAIGSGELAVGEAVLLCARELNSVPFRIPEMWAAGRVEKRDVKKEMQDKQPPRIFMHGVVCT